MKLQAGGSVAWDMQGEGADEELVVYETQHVEVHAVDGGKLPDRG